MACVVTSVPVGVSVLLTSRLPTWMKGWIKWPLGDNLSPEVVRLFGFANVLIGASSLVLAALVLALPGLLTSRDLPVRWIVGSVLAVTVVLLVAGVVPYIRSVLVSRS